VQRRSTCGLGVVLCCVSVCRLCARAEIDRDGGEDSLVKERETHTQYVPSFVGALALERIRGSCLHCHPTFLAEVRTVTCVGIWDASWLKVSRRVRVRVRVRVRLRVKVRVKVRVRVKIRVRVKVRFKVRVRVRVRVRAKKMDMPGINRRPDLPLFFGIL
jgi:hypothetical protein